MNEKILTVLLEAQREFKLLTNGNTVIAEKEILLAGIANLVKEVTKIDKPSGKHLESQLLAFIPPSPMVKLIQNGIENWLNEAISKYSN